MHQKLQEAAPDAPGGLLGDERPPGGTGPLAVRIAYHEAQIRELRQQQRLELVAAIAAAVPAGRVFSAKELWNHQAVNPALASAYTYAGIRNPRQLGKRLRQLAQITIDDDLSKVTIDRGFSLERVGADHAGALWVCR